MRLLLGCLFILLFSQHGFAGTQPDQYGYAVAEKLVANLDDHFDEAPVGFYIKAIKSKLNNYCLDHLKDESPPALTQCFKRYRDRATRTLVPKASRTCNSNRVRLVVTIGDNNSVHAKLDMRLNDQEIQTDAVVAPNIGAFCAGRFDPA